MSRNVLRGLFNGNIIPWERKEPHNEELVELVGKIEEEEQYFIGKMSQDDRERLQKLSNLYSQLSCVGDESLLSYGFTLGLLLAMDVMEEAKLLYNE
ncbi:MAG: DUF6809 family protein [Sporomusa sp.]